MRRRIGIEGDRRQGDGKIQMKGPNPVREKAATGRDDKVRVTVDLSQNGYNRLQKLAAVAHSNSASVLRQALQLYEFVVEKTAEGNTFKMVNEKAGTETAIAFLGYSD